MRNTETKDEFGSIVNIGDLVSIPSPSGVLLDRRDLIQGRVTKIYPKSVEVFIRTGQGGFMKVFARSFILIPKKPDIEIETENNRYRVWYSFYRTKSLDKKVVFQTTCRINIGGLGDFFGSVTNHIEDKFDSTVGKIEASKKAFSVVEDKKVKRALWDKLLKRGVI